MRYAYLKNFNFKNACNFQKRTISISYHFCSSCTLAGFHSQQWTLSVLKVAERANFSHRVTPSWLESWVRDDSQPVIKGEWEKFTLSYLWPKRFHGRLRHLNWLSNHTVGYWTSSKWMEAIQQLILQKFKTRFLMGNFVPVRTRHSNALLTCFTNFRFLDFFPRFSLDVLTFNHP